jgi:hypothetical protein
LVTDDPVVAAENDSEVPVSPEIVETPVVKSTLVASCHT